MLSDAFLHKLDSLQLSSRALARSGAGGARRSRALGTSAEFSDYREYLAGDDLRRVDWNAYARFERLFLKLFTEEREARVNLLVDMSASMGFGQKSKKDVACDIALSLCYLALRAGDRVRLFALHGARAQQSPELHGRADMVRADAFFSAQIAEGETSLNAAVRALPLPQGAGVSVLLTDLMDENGYDAALASLLYRRQEVTLVHVLCQDELSPPYTDAVRLIDSETDAPVELMITREVLDAYKSALEDLTSGAQGWCASHGAGFVRADTTMDMEREVLRALARAGLIG